MYKGATVALAAAALVAVETSAASAAESHGEYQQVVHVAGTGSSVALDHRHIRAGSIQFAVTTTSPNGSNIVLFKPKRGKSSADVQKDLADEVGPNGALGTRELMRDATFYGLADIAGGASALVTENLDPGRYFALDLAGDPSAEVPQRLDVSADRRGVEQDSDLASQVYTAAVEPDRFQAPRVWPHKGTFTFYNRSDTLHFMDLIRVKPGTTDAEIQKYFDSQSQDPPPFAMDGPGAGIDVLSPGHDAQVSYDLPTGTYVLLCFVADDQTGMPHAAMGMHKVVVLH
jgi:hypothetical protein